LTLLC